MASPPPPSVGLKISKSTPQRSLYCFFVRFAYQQIHLSNFVKRQKIAEKLAKIPSMDVNCWFGAFSGLDSERITFWMGLALLGARIPIIESQTTKRPKATINH